MLVFEVMTGNPVTVRAGTSVKAALGLLAEHRVTAMPVVNGSGKVIGVISEADLIRELLAPDPRAHEIPIAYDERVPAQKVEEVMSPHPVTVHPDADLADAVDLLTSTAVKSLPVVDRHGRLHGILSRSDIVRLLARADSEIEGEIDELLRSTGLTDWLVDVHGGSVELLGPEGTHDAALASRLAETVPGVVEVTTREESRP